MLEGTKRCIYRSFVEQISLPVSGGIVIGGLVGIVVGGFVVLWGVVALAVVGFGVASSSSHTPHVFEHLSSTSWQPSSLRSSTHSKQ